MGRPKKEKALTREQVVAALERNGYIQSRAAKDLGISPPTMANKIRRFSIIFPSHKRQPEYMLPAVPIPDPPSDKLTAVEVLRREQERIKDEAGYAALTTDEERIMWFAKQGVQSNDIATQLGLGLRLTRDSDYKTKFEEIVARGHAEMRIELAQTIYTEARLGRVTALKEAARAHLDAYKDQAPSTEFAGGYRAKVDELLAKIADKHHEHVRRRFKFDEQA